MRKIIIIILILAIGIIAGQDCTGSYPAEQFKQITVSNPCLLSVRDSIYNSGNTVLAGDLTISGDITQAQTQSTNDYTWLQYSQWSTNADMPAGGTYGLYGKANVGHTVQNAISGKGSIKFLTLAADESINYGAGFEATLELDDVDTWTITVEDHISALNLYFDGSSKVSGSGSYSKMNLSRAMWNSTENFSIETNGYQIETAPSSHLDYGFNFYNSGTSTAGIWIHNNCPQGGSIDAGVLMNSDSFTYAMDLNGAGIATADIRGHEGEIIFNDPDGTWGFGVANLVTAGNIEAVNGTLDSTLTCDSISVRSIAGALNGNATTASDVDTTGADIKVSLGNRQPLCTTLTQWCSLVDSVTSGAADSVVIGWAKGKPDTLIDVR